MSLDNIMDMTDCTLCPRSCRANRAAGEVGYCKQAADLYAARAALYFDEEPVISGRNGSGAVFFSGCNMGCVYCQNYAIAKAMYGTRLEPSRLSDIFLELQEQGAENINLVTADHFAAAVAESLTIYRPHLPVVYNCSGYTSPKTLTMLDGLVDVYLPDFKYADDALAVRLSQAPDYVNTATAAIKEMLFQTGTPRYDSEGIMQKGVIVRHLILPAHTRNSIAVLELLKRHFDGQLPVSLMCQYVPCGEARRDPKLGRTVTRREYDKVKRVLFQLDMDGFTQDLASASADFIPEWTFED